MERYRIGVDVGGTKIAYGLFDEKKNLIDKYKYPSDKSLEPEAFAGEIVGHMRAIMEEKGIAPEQLVGIGIGVPSFVLFEEGYIVKTSNLPKLREFAARDFFQREMGCRVVLDNDANTAALAEYRYGAGRGFEHIIYCPVSTGISNGIIINGRLFRGTYGWAGESGHMIADLDAKATYCSCGNPGCFESHISGGRIVHLAAERIRGGEASILSEICGGNLDSLSAKDLFHAYQKDDPVAIWAVEHMARYLGVWLYNLYLAFNINCYVFGGGLTNFGDALFRRAEEVFLRHNKDPRPVHFKIAELGQDFGIIGAAELLD